MVAQLNIHNLLVVQHELTSLLILSPEWLWSQGTLANNSNRFDAFLLIFPLTYWFGNFLRDEAERRSRNDINLNKQTNGMRENHE